MVKGYHTDVTAQIKCPREEAQGVVFFHADFEEEEEEEKEEGRKRKEEKRGKPPPHAAYPTNRLHLG